MRAGMVRLASGDDSNARFSTKMNPMAMNTRNKARHNGKVKLETLPRYTKRETIPPMTLIMPPDPQMAPKTRMPTRLFCPTEPMKRATWMAKSAPTMANATPRAMLMMDSPRRK